MNFISVPFRNLIRRPTRSMLTLLGIAVAVGSFIALSGMSRGLELAWTNSVLERGTHIAALKSGVVEILTASIDESTADALSRVDGVKAVAGELIDLTQLSSGHTALVAGWGRGSYLWNTLHLSSGTLPDSDGNAIMGQSIAESLGKKPGDKMSLQGREFTVAGIFKQKGAMSNNTIIIPLADMQELMHRQGKVTQFNIRLKNFDDRQDVASVKSRLKESFPQLSFHETGELAENNEVLKLLRAMVWGVSVIAFVMALVIVLNTLLMSVTERTREIGIFSSIGWSAGRILMMFVLEGLLLSVIGSLAGGALGVGGLHWLVKLPRLQGFIEFHITPELLIHVSVAAIILGLIGSIYPAWRATKLDPVNALRAD